jgi:hypothetical protein
LTLITSCLVLNLFELCRSNWLALIVLSSRPLHTKNASQQKDRSKCEPCFLVVAINTHLQRSDLLLLDCKPAAVPKAHSTHPWTCFASVARN